MKKQLHGLINFEEEGMPWTKVSGVYRLIRKECLEVFGDEPHWLIDLGKNETCHIPESNVVVLPDGIPSEELERLKKLRK